MKRLHPLRAFLGFFLTILLFSALLVYGITSALKQSVLKGDSLSDILESTYVYETIEDIVIAEFSDKYSELGISGEAVSEIMDNDMVKNTLSDMTESVLSGKHVDLSGMKDNVMEIADSTASAAIDEAFDAAGKHSGTIALKDIVSDTAFQDMEKRLGVSVGKKVLKTATDKLGTDTIDLDTAASKQSKQVVKDAVSKQILPAISKTYDTYIADVNSVVNDAVDELNKNYSLSEGAHNINQALSYFSSFVRMIMYVCIALALLQLLLYMRDIHKAFKNCSLSCLFSGIIMLFITMGFDFANNHLDDVVKSESATVDNITKAFLENNLSSVSDACTLVTILLFTGFIVLMVISVLAKKLKGPDDTGYDSGDFGESRSHGYDYIDYK